MSETYYITTAIFYPNAEPHIGSALEVIGADVAARYRRLCGEEVFFQTGMDEHGEKIQKRAEERGVDPKTHTDEMAEKFRRTFDALDISCDNFIRTTSDEHKIATREILRRCHENGDIYKGHYEGWYCYRCERFFPANQLNDDKTCPDHGEKLSLLNEEAYFFKLNEYADKLLAFYEANPGFIVPESRMNEMKSFVKGGLDPLCISRTSIHWGIPLPMEEGHVIYVWFDALTNYLTGVGFGRDEETFNKWWPADDHIIGKDIVRFHCVIWPAMLMSAGIALPKRVVGHGFVNLRTTAADGSEQEVKISKSILRINAEDVAAQYGPDALRYFLMREVPFTGDGLYSEAGLVQRFNSDLANDLGNLLHRTLTMIEKYSDGVAPEPGAEGDLEAELKRTVVDVVARVDPLIRHFNLKEALETAWEVVTAANVYIEKNEPWRMAKDPERADRLKTVLYSMAEATRIVMTLVYPYMPRATTAMSKQLGLDTFPGTLPGAAEWGQLAPGTKVAKGAPVFPRIDTKK